MKSTQFKQLIKNELARLRDLVIPNDFVRFNGVSKYQYPNIMERTILMRQTKNR
jgi:hypothetical protein